MAPVESNAGLQEWKISNLSGASREETLIGLQKSEVSGQVQGADLSMLDWTIDEELIDHMLHYCAAVGSGGAALRLAHNDLGSGTDCEQRIFELKAERELRQIEKERAEQKKRDSSKQKDFAVSAGMRREGAAGIEKGEADLKEIDLKLAELDRRKVLTPWHILFSQMEARDRNSIMRLDLSNCGLHTTGIIMLTQALLELEHRGDGEAVEELILDGNDLGDAGTSPLASFLRLSSCLTVLRVRNIGVTDGGMSQVMSGLVSNKNLALLDLRGNGLTSLEMCKAAMGGVKRFNTTAQILIE
ncbi:unnamed protein product [Polarella glacialis]|uniref:Uncharacterized protein n=1 Tax=Polarella glacialis TaxID=89957 RepID=A0A813D1S1_POLGL|nr:unnamed protein product [Polarella glacialis]